MRLEQQTTYENREAELSALVDSAVAGDSESFEILVSQCTPYVRGVILTKGNEPYLEDVLQETYLRAFRNIQRFDNTTPNAFKTWLVTIAKNVLRNRYTKLRRRREVPFVIDPDDPEYTHDPGYIDDLEEGLQLSDRARILAIAMNSIPSHHKAYLEAVHYEGLSYIDTAQRFDTTFKAVKSLLSRARANLQEELEKHPDFAPVD